jgi:hypothetical protein
MRGASRAVCDRKTLLRTRPQFPGGLNPSRSAVPSTVGYPDFMGAGCDLLMSEGGHAMLVLPGVMDPWDRSYARRESSGACRECPCPGEIDGASILHSSASRIGATLHIGRFR